MGSEEIFTAIATRRSIKRFTNQPVEIDKVLQIIQAGVLAPSAGNLQNWNFVVVTDTDKIRELYHHTLDQEPFLSAMAAIVVCGDVEYAHTMYGMRGKRLYTIQNCAAAIQNMLLAASAVKLGALWVGAFDEDKVSLTFNIPSHRHRPQAIILLGYPAETPEPKETKPLESVVFFNQFGNRVLRPHLVFYDWATEWRNQSQNIKNHTKHAVDIVKAKHADSKAQKEKEEQSKPQGPSAIERAREHVRKRLEGLKREEY